MKFHPASTCLFLALFLVTGCSRSQAGPPPHRITVTGTAIIKIAPDEMLWTVQVTINDATLAKAKARHDASLTATLDYLKSLGTTLKDLQTGGIQFSRASYDDNDTFLKKNPYNCATQVTFTLLDFDQYGPIADKLSHLDGVETDAVGYGSSKEAETRREALRRALQDGRDKAADLAETAGCGLGQPLSIDEVPNVSVQPETMNVAYSGGLSNAPAGTPQAVAGQIEFDGAVNVTYELQPGK